MTFFSTKKEDAFLDTLLNWMQYRLLISMDDEHRREYYEIEAVRNSWTGREMERQISSGLFERLLLSNDKESVMAIARSERLPELPHEIVKDPMILEFLGLERKPLVNPKTVGRIVPDYRSKYQYAH